jgi:hypothetical protein
MMIIEIQSTDLNDRPEKIANEILTQARKGWIPQGIRHRVDCVEVVFKKPEWFG